ITDLHSQNGSIFLLCNGYVETVIGVAGERVTLPCGYSVKTYGVTDTCWGRGEVPYSKCSKMVVSTEGDKVTYRQSDRYKLLGRVRKGNVSLTIINATEADTGIYGCRVEVPGLFNDLKYNVLLLIVEQGKLSSEFSVSIIYIIHFEAEIIGFK
uniref:Ig-like domain-containing protein n=1 Tax=Scleropages formosus TaxID=113540 RepID=A0A8C9S2W9_SCLFO